MISYIHTISSDSLRAGGDTCRYSVPLNKFLFKWDFIYGRVVGKPRAFTKQWCMVDGVAPNNFNVCTD